MVMQLKKQYEEEMGFDYAHPEVVQEGVNFGELADIRANKEILDKIVFLGKRFQPYVNLKHKEFIFSWEKLYLRKLRRNNGKAHQGYKLVLHFHRRYQSSIDS